MNTVFNIDYFFTTLIFLVTLVFIFDILYKVKKANTLVIPELPDGRLVLVKNSKSHDKWEVVKERVDVSSDSSAEHIAHMAKKNSFGWSEVQVSYLGTITCDEAELFVLSAKINNLRNLALPNHHHLFNQLQVFSMKEVTEMIQSSQITDAASLAALKIKQG